MAGVRRRLRDVGKTVSGVLGVRLGEVSPDPGPEVPEEVPTAADAALPQTGGPEPAQEESAVIQTAPEPSAAEPGPAVAEQDAAVPVGLEPVDLLPPADAVLVAAVEVARVAAQEVGGSAVGDHLGAVAEGPGNDGPVVAHSFATTDPAYVGWRWVVSLARADGSDVATVDEVVLLPGGDALLAPGWLPWSDRVQPADLSPGDLLPTRADDPRLVPAYADVDGPDAALADAVSLELGLGRVRVLSLEGRLDTAERWWDGEAGPDTPMAKQAPGQCVDCGFLVPLAGGLRQAFGVCANALAPDDGRVVALAHGCGAHSETVVDAPHAATAGLVVEDDEFELVPTSSAPPATGDAPTGDAPTGDAPTEEAPAEDTPVEDTPAEDAAAATETSPSTE